MARKQTATKPAAEPQPDYTVVKRERSRFWDVLDPAGELMCVTAISRARKRWCGGSPREA